MPNLSVTGHLGVFPGTSKRNCQVFSQCRLAPNAWPNVVPLAKERVAVHRIAPPKQGAGPENISPSTRIRR